MGLGDPSFWRPEATMWVEWVLSAESPPPLGSEAHPQTPDCVCKFVSFAAHACLVPAAACARLVPATTHVW